MSEQNPQEWVSKKRMKKQMNDLQDLGVQLTRLSADTLKKIGLPEDLLEALLAHKKINNTPITDKIGKMHNYRVAKILRL